MKKRFFVLAFLGAVMASIAPTGAAAADGVLIAQERLPQKARLALATEIDAAKRDRPETFEALRVLRKALPALDAKKRGRLAPIPTALKGLGKDALLPMLEELAFRAEPRGNLTESAWIAWRAGLIEAVGVLRDPRAEHVLAAILDGPETDFFIVRAAAEALGRLGTDAAAQKLVAMAKTTSVKRQAVIAGMGECRRQMVATALAELVAARPDPETARRLARSLGDVGSAWAWKTPIISSSGEEKPTRAIAAKALVELFVAHDGQVRKTASNALMVVDHPSTPALIDIAKRGTTPEVAAELDSLAHRFARNPTR